MDNPKLTWWGYLHTNNKLQLKRYFDSRDLDEAKESPFVQRIFGPFQAVNWETAFDKLEELSREKIKKDE